LVVWDSVFTSSELDAVERLGDRLMQQPAAITGQGQLDPAVRITRVAWITPQPEHKELFARIAAVVNRLNAQFFRWDIT